MRGIARAIGVLALAGIVLGGVVAYRLYHTLEKIDHQVAAVQGALRGFFQTTPRLVVNHKTVWGEPSPVAEFAAASMDGDFDEEWRQTFLHSTKKVFVHARYRAKAGFDLTRDFQVRIEKGNVTVFLPPAQILSVEMIGDLKVRGENGLINWLTDVDFQSALREFQIRARAQAEQSGLQAQAENWALLSLQKEVGGSHAAIRFQKEK